MLTPHFSPPNLKFHFEYKHKKEKMKTLKNPKIMRTQKRENDKATKACSSWGSYLRHLVWSTEFASHFCGQGHFGNFGS